MINQEWFADQVSLGNGYVFESALAGVALIAATTSANKMLLVNPPQSQRVFVIYKITFGRTAVGTPLEGAIVYNTGRAASISVSAGTGNDVVSYTAVAGQNLRTGGADQSGMIFAPATSVLTTTPTFYGAPGLAQTADAGATTVSGPRSQQLVDYIHGTKQIFPGYLFTIGASVSLSTAYHIAIYGVSVPRQLFTP